MSSPVNDERWAVSGIRKRSIRLPGHKTSLSLEDEFWDALRKIPPARGKRLPDNFDLAGPRDDVTALFAWRRPLARLLDFALRNAGYRADSTPIAAPRLTYVILKPFMSPAPNRPSALSRLSSSDGSLPYRAPRKIQKPGRAAFPLRMRINFSLSGSSPSGPLGHLDPRQDIARVEPSRAGARAASTPMFTSTQGFKG
jgi:hypothetical protein